MQKKILKCPICHSKEIVNADGLSGYLTCKNCQVIWLARPPKIIYQADYYKAKTGLMSYTFSPIGAFFYWIRKLYVGKGKKTLWIDVGAGAGEFIKTVNAKEKIGIEVSSAGRDLMKKQGIQAISPQLFDDKQNLNADVISLWHVLEHVRFPNQVLKVARANISKKGKMIIGVPNSDSWEMKFFGKHWFHLAPNHHIWHFNLNSLQALLKGNNFKIEKIDYWSPEHQLAGLVQSFINKSSNSENVLHKLVKRDVYSGNIGPKEIFWITFWLTIGLPIIFVWWIIASFAKKSGTIVVVAQPVVPRAPKS